MTGVSHEIIMRFISNFHGAEDVFLNGCCYWFALILQARFGGTIFYDPIRNHFVCRIGERFYDVSGETHSEEYCNWEMFSLVDYREYQRIIRDCIDKVEEAVI